MSTYSGLNSSCGSARGDLELSPDPEFSRATERGDADRFGERSHTVLLLGRERVRDVLEPHLGASRALERANNIAQALALEEAQPDAVAFEMLRQVPDEERRQLAAAVRREWLAVEFAQFRAARAASAL